MREEVKDFNKISNAKYQKNVKYLYYDDAKNFINLNNIIQYLSNNL